MGVRILYDAEQELATFYCSTAGTVIGPLVRPVGDLDARDSAEAFLQWVQKAFPFASDIRALTPEFLAAVYEKWHQAEVVMPHEPGNTIAREGYDRCDCGCKYWEQDKCIDCGFHLLSVELRAEREAQEVA